MASTFAERMMTNIQRALSYFKNLPATAYLIVAIIAGGGSWLYTNNLKQQELGAERIILGQLQLVLDSAKKDVALKQVALDKKNSDLDSLVANFAARQARVVAAKAATDLVAKHLLSARDSLVQTIQDSMATIQELRSRATRLVQVSDSMEKVRLRERFVSDSSLSAAKAATTFAVDSVRKASVDALNAMLKRATTAERLGKITPSGKVSWWSRCGISGGGGAVVADGKLRGGPGVMVGCRLLP